MAVETQETPATPTATRTLVHYEIPAADADKLIAFYSGVFGWTFEGPPGMETYRMAATTDDEEGVSVAIYPRENGGQATNYVSVESVQAYVTKIEAHGGTVVHRFTVPGMGHGAVALDPEHNPLGIWQRDPAARPE